MLASLMCVIAGAALFAQTSKTDSSDAQAATTAVNVKVVNVLAAVRDKHGKIVPNLGKDDFTLLEDGHPVTIGYFSSDTNQSLTLGLLVDTSFGRRTVLDDEKTASKTFLNQMLREKDAAFVIHFDREVELLQDLTSSREKIESAVDQLRTPSLEQRDSSPDSGDPDSTGEGRRRGGLWRARTTLYDAIYLASDELMRNQKGRKTLIILSDGVDQGSKETLESAIEAAQRANTLIYAILFKEEFAEHRGFGMGRGRRAGYPGGYPQEEHMDGKKILERISRETGGRMFEVSKKNPIAQIYASIEEELRNQYNIGFTPGKTDALGYHKLELKAKPKDSTVQARQGYYLTQ